MEFKNEKLQIAFNEAVYKQTVKKIDDINSNIGMMLCVTMLLIGIAFIFSINTPLMLLGALFVLPAFLVLVSEGRIINSVDQKSWYKNMYRIYTNWNKVTLDAKSEVESTFVAETTKILGEELTRFKKTSLSELEAQLTELETIKQ